MTGTAVIRPYDPSLALFARAKATHLYFAHGGAPNVCPNGMVAPEQRALKWAETIKASP